jgi:hypothetical protein
VIGRWGVKKIDDGGVWVRAQLDARSEYINEIKELVSQDALGFSSGTMGHLVKVSGKTGEILKWALVELSLTPNPANPNAYIVRANKSAAAHVKSLFATKHGDHDQSEHGSWATGGGSDKGGRVAAAQRSTENQRASVMDAITSLPKADRYVHLLHLVAVDKALEKGNWEEAMNAAGQGRAEANRLGQTYIADDFMRLNIAITTIAADEYDKDSKKSIKHGDHDQSDHAPTGSGKGPKEGESKRTQYDQDALRASDKLGRSLAGTGKARAQYKEYANAVSDLVSRGEYKRAIEFAKDVAREAFVNGHDKASEAFNAVASASEAAANNGKTIYGDLTKTRGGKRMLKVKRTVKHGDHDQSEHGAWATGGGAGDKGRVPPSGWSDHPPERP